MEIVLIVIIATITLFYSRIAFLISMKSDTNAFSSWSTLLAFRNLYLINNKISKEIYRKYYISLFLGLISSLFLFFALFNILNNNIANLTIILHLIFVTVSFGALLYLAIYDLLYYEISARFLNALLAIVVIFNILATLNILFLQNNTLFLGNTENLLSGIVLGFIFWLALTLTKEKGMGMGDVLLMFGVGLSLGVTRSIVAYLITLLIASIVGIIIALFNRSFKSLIIPLVPFIFLGFIISLALPYSFLHFFLPF